MKRKLSALLAVMLLVCSLFAMPALAETVMKDGLEVTLITDQEEYDALETIHAKLIVKNTNDFAVENVKLKYSAPEGYKLAYGVETEIASLAAGAEQQLLTSMLKQDAEAPILPQTGDDSRGVLWSALLVVAVAALCVLAIRHPQGKRIMSIFLCVAIVAPCMLQVVPALAQEQAAEGRIVVSKSVTVANKTVTITGTVTHNLVNKEVSADEEEPILAVALPKGSLTVSPGDRIRLYSQLTGYGYRYQWYYRANSSAAWKKLSCTSSSYYMTVKENHHGYQFYFKYTDRYGRTGKSNVVTLKLPVAKITTQPKSQTVAPGKKATFTVKATGTGLKYQWYYRAKSGAAWKKLSCTKATYAVTVKNTHNGYQFFCKVSDKYGYVVNSSTATLKLPKLSITTQPKSQTLAVGKKATFTVKATGDGLKYQWYYRAKSSAAWKKLSCTRASYATTVKSTHNGYQFFCKVSDKYGNVVNSSTATLKLPSSIKITAQPKSAKKPVGEKATFTVKATGDGLKYQWYFRTSSTAAWQKASGTKASYTMTVKGYHDGYQFYCKVTDQHGRSVNSSVCTVRTAKYRALLIGQDYIGNTVGIGTLPGCADDIAGMKKMLALMKNTKYTVTTKKNLTAAGMEKAISAAFGAADANDVSLIYYSGHGLDSYLNSEVGALVGYDFSYLTVAELKAALDKIKGKKIIILDSCHSGAHIGKSVNQDGVSALERFNNAVIAEFATQAKANNLANSNYYVITAARSTESSYTGYPYSVFTTPVVRGSGLDRSDMPADQNGDKMIELHECYDYAYTEALRIKNQHAQVYPTNSQFVLWAK